MKAIALFLPACLLVSACAQHVDPRRPTVSIVAGTATGDPCASERMLIDTPRGYPRVCLNGRWTPYCELPSADSVYCE